MVSIQAPIIHEATTVNPDPTEFMPVEVNSAFPKGSKSTFNSREKAQIDKFIDEVPDKNDTRAINYWLVWGERHVYLEGWIDKCLAGTGFPKMEGGEWDAKIEYMIAATRRTLIAKQEDGSLSPSYIVEKLPLTLIEGGFREFEAGEKAWLYGVTWGVYKQAAVAEKEARKMPKEQIGEGAFVRLKSGTEGWVKGQIVEYYDLIPSVGGMIYTGPGYKVHILEGKHKGETIKVPANYVELLGPSKTKREPLYPHVPRKKEPLFPHVPRGQQPVTKLPAPRYEFFPESVRRRLPPIGATGEQKDPIVQVKFFTPWTNWTWYGIEFDGKDIFFGWVVGLENEFGSFSLSELQSLRGPVGLKIERDIYFEPKPISQVMKEHSEMLPASTEGNPRAIGWSPQTKEKLYQRGTDGYPIGADKIMRDAWGPIPDPDQPFWSKEGFIKPVKVYGWSFSPDYNQWRAYVRFPDGTETWTSPREQTGGRLI